MYGAGAVTDRTCQKCFAALAGVAQWIVYWSVNWAGEGGLRGIAGLVPSQGECLGCEPGPWLGVCKGQLIYVSFTQQCFFPSRSPSLPTFLKMNK